MEKKSKDFFFALLIKWAKDNPIPTGILYNTNLRSAWPTCQLWGWFPTRKVCWIKLVPKTIVKKPISTKPPDKRPPKKIKHHLRSLKNKYTSIAKGAAT